MTPSLWEWGSLGGRNDVLMVIPNSVVQPVLKGGGEEEEGGGGRGGGGRGRRNKQRILLGRG